MKCGNALVEVLATVIFIFYGKQKQITFALKKAQVATIMISNHRRLWSRNFGSWDSEAGLLGPALLGLIGSGSAVLDQTDPARGPVVRSHTCSCKLSNKSTLSRTFLDK